MPIDREKALGASLGESQASYEPDDVILYHLGIGAGFEATDRGGETISIDKVYVESRVADLAKDTDLSKFIL